MLGSATRSRMPGAPVHSTSFSADSAPLTFGGELPVYAEPTAGPVIDLNLMVRRGRWRAELSRHALPQPGAVTLAADTTILIALTPLRVTVQGKRYALARLDALQLEEVAQCKVQPAATQPRSAGARCCTTLSDSIL